MTKPLRIFSLTPAVAALAFLGSAYGSTAAGSTAAAPAQGATSATVIGASSLLSDGASALEAGRAEEGLRLTLAGLNEPGLPHALAAGHANACAGFLMLKQLDEALAHCNQSIQMDPTNWRAFNNRAAIYDARGLYDLAIHDIEAGLLLAPKSRTLLQSMRVIRRNQRLLESRDRRSVPS
jgi:tetratricopeptide (TPR) repeat protein